jgi:hypothetical protein
MKKDNNDAVEIIAIGLCFFFICLGIGSCAHLISQ